MNRFRVAYRCGSCERNFYVDPPASVLAHSPTSEELRAKAEWESQLHCPRCQSDNVQRHMRSTPSSRPNNVMNPGIRQQLIQQAAYAERKVQEDKRCPVCKELVSTLPTKEKPCPHCFGH